MKKRYNDGGLPDYEREPDAQDKAQQKGAVEEYYTKKYGYNKDTDGEILDNEFPEPKKMSFKEAFAEARADGKKTFEWEGKKYTTELAKPSLAEKAKKSGFTSAETKGGAALMTRKDRKNDKPMYKSGGSVSASRRADGCAVRGKTRGKMV